MALIAQSMNFPKWLNRAAPRFNSLRVVISALGCAGLIALAARVQVPIWGNPIPLSLTPQVVCWLGWAFPDLARPAVAAYLLGVAGGLPLLGGGLGGVASLIGPRGGYLLGYWLAARWLSSRQFSTRHCEAPFGATLLAMWAGSALILTCGFVWLARFTGIAPAWRLGVLPFLAGDLLLKCPLIAWISSRGGPLKTPSPGRFSPKDL